MLFGASPDRDDTPFVQKSATISECGRFRYALERSVPGVIGPALCWLMLNPSTADASKDDPTIRKVVGFTQRAGFGVAIVVNLFAYRATDPQRMRARWADSLSALAESEGVDNERAIRELRTVSNTVVCAWGAFPWVSPQVSRVLPWLGAMRRVCLGTSQSGAPRHPLMVPYAQPLVQFTEAP